MGLIDWLLGKIEQNTAKAQAARLAKQQQEQREKEAYDKAYSEARVNVAVKEAKLDAEYGGHFKRVVATGLKNLKATIDENKKKRKKSNAMSLTTPIEAKVK